MVIKDYKVVSVESRKGGVGKTTVAEMISEVIYNPAVQQDREAKVIFLDLDICGTSIKYLKRSGVYNHMEFTDLNLVHMFEDFMAGKDIKVAECNFKKKNIMLIHSVIENNDNKTLHTPQG